MAKKDIAVNESPINMFMQGVPKAEKPKKNTINISVVTHNDKKKQLQKIAWVQRKTLNKLINKVLDDYIAEHQKEITIYDKEYND